MKTIVFFVLAILISTFGVAQVSVGKINLSHWIGFSGSRDKPTFKKFDNSLFYAFYKTNADSAGIIVLDQNLNVQKNFVFKVTSVDNSIYLPELKLNFIENPLTYYQKEEHSIVLAGVCKISDFDFAAVALTFSLDSNKFIKVHTLHTSKQLDFEIKLSDEDTYLVVSKTSVENNKSEKILNYDVFNTTFEKLYAVSLEFPKSAQTFYRITSNGEMVHGTVIEKGKRTSIEYHKFDASGLPKGELKYVTNTNDIYSYYLTHLIISPTNDIYSVCSKKLEEMEGYVIFKLDFELKSCTTVIEKIFDKKILSQIFNPSEIDKTLVETEKIKPVKILKNFGIHSAFIDNEGIYLLLNDTKVDYHQVNTGGDIIKSFAGENILIAGYAFNGTELWISPIKRDALCVDVMVNNRSLNRYFPDGSGIDLKTYEDKDFINVLIPSLGRIYATRINKKTGKEITPTLLYSDEKTYTNSNACLWINSSKLLLITMKNVYNEKSKREVFLNLMGLN